MVDINETLDEMPEDEMLLLVNFPGGIGGIKEKFELIYDLVKKPHLFHILFQIGRPGCQEWTFYLEHEYFPPGTPLNEEFQSRFLKWRDIQWGLISIPFEKKQFAFDAAERGKICLSNIMPVMITPNNVEPTRFPAVSETLYTAINKGDSLIYESGGPHDTKIEESYRIKKYLEEKGIEDAE